MQREQTRIVSEEHFNDQGKTITEIIERLISNMPAQEIDKQ